MSTSLDRSLDSLRACARAMTERSGRWVERDGVSASMEPHVPERALANSVFYERGADVDAAYDWLEELYAQAEAWTVWVPDDDEETAAALAARGHVMDADPLAMVVDLAAFEPPAELPDWQRATVDQIAQINEAAYPWQDGTMERMLLGGLSDQFHLYAAGDDSALGVYDHEDDAYITYVATRPEARGRGLASGLLSVALVEARERNQSVSSLHATKAGAPVYARLGYESVGVVQMWETRR